jgi:hypothetical protein
VTRIVSLPDRNADLAQRIAELLSEHLALVVQIPLGGDIVEIEGISIRLIGKRGAVTENNDQPAGP